MYLSKHLLLLFLPETGILLIEESAVGSFSKGDIKIPVYV